MKQVYAPGCALLLYKPRLSEKIHDFLKNHLHQMEMLTTCCRLHPDIEAGTQVINTCPGCNNRYKNNYTESTTISLWEILAKRDTFQFPDYKGETMTILDACPTRNESIVHDAIRTLLRRMNIEVIESEKTRETGSCCGDSYYGKKPVEYVMERMRSRADEMPVENVVVYCVSCVKSMYLGGKKPRYLVDLLFSECTDPQTYEPDAWHEELDTFAGVNPPHNKFEVKPLSITEY